TTNSNVTNPPGGGGGGGGGTGPDPNNPCAFYLDDTGAATQGTFDDPHCTYSREFVDSNNRLMFDLEIPALANGGAHIFEGSLFVGENYTSDADLQNAGIAQGGDGPTLTVEA